MKSHQEKLYHLALILSEKITPRRYFDILKKYKSLEVFFSLDKIEQNFYLKKNKINGDIHFSELLKKAEKELDIYEKEGIYFMPLCDEEYPYRLKEIHFPPIGLFILGKYRGFKSYFQGKKKRNIAIVGTRKAKQYICEVTKTIAYELSEKGNNIISGFASGIDGAAHRGAISSGGRTIAVFGCGVRNIYPQSHKHLYRDMIETGNIILSEYHPSTQPLNYFFPIRNRIIAGLSDGIVLMEAPSKSGALITVKYGIEENRDIFTYFPKESSKNFEGNYELISQGAFAIYRSEDIIKHLHGEKIPEDLVDKENDEILKFLSNGPISVSELSKCLNRTPDEVLIILTPYILEGKVNEAPGNKFYKNFYRDN